MRKTVLLIFIALAVAMIAALEVLYYLSTRRQGLVESQSNLRYLWTYGPTAVLIVFAAFWGRVEYETQLTAPWLKIESKGNSSDAMLMDYVNMFSLSVPFRALKNGDYRVAAVSTISLLLVVQTVISTALFTLSSVEVFGVSAPIVINSQFVDDPTRLKNPSTLPYPAMEGLTTDNMTYPDGCSDTYAYQSFSSNRSDFVEVSTTVDGISFELDCEVSTSALVQVDYGRMFENTGFGIWSMDNSKMRFAYDGCHTNLSLETAALQPATNATAANGVKRTLNIMSLNAILGFGSGQCGSKDTESTRLIFLSAQLDYMYTNVTNGTWVGNDGYDVKVKTLDIRSTSLICAPRFDQVSLNVTMNATGIQSITNVGNAPSETLSQVRPWDILKAQLNTLGGSGYAVSAPTTIGNTTVAGNDYFGVVMQACEADCAEESSLLDSNLLQKYLKNYYRQYSAFLLHQSLKSPVEVEADGQALILQNRLMVQPLACHLMVGIFALSVLIFAAVLVTLPGTIVFPLVPGSIISYAIISALAMSEKVPNFIGGADKRGLAVEIRDWMGESVQKTQRLQTTAVEQIETPGVQPSWKPKLIYPAALNTYSRSSLYVFMIACVATLEATLHVSSRNNGLGSVPDETYLHYAWTTFPAVILSLLRILLSSMDFQTRLLVPYQALSRGASFEYLRLDLLRPVLPITLLKEFRIKNPGAFMSTIAALIASVFTIGAASLFHADTFSVSNTGPLRATTTLLMERPYNFEGLVETSSLYSAALILGSNLSYTPYVYEDLIIPAFTLDDYLATSNTIITNKSSLIVKATVPALRPGLSCSLYPTSSISAGEFFNRKLDTISIKTFNGISVNVTGQQCSETKYTLPEVAYTNSTATFKTNLTSEFYFGTSTLTEGLYYTYPCSDDYLYIWGHYPGPDTSVDIAVSALGCNRTAESVDVEMTYIGTDLQLDVSNPPRPIESTAKEIPGHHDINSNDIFNVIYGWLDSLPPPNNTAFDNFFSQLVTSRYAIPISYLGDSTQAEAVRDAIIFQDGVFAAQYLDRMNRVHLNASLSEFPALSSASTTNDTGIYNATITEPWASPRVVQDPVGTRILDGLLLAALVLSVLSWLLGPRKPVLPRSPTSIASVLALLQGGDILKPLYEEEKKKQWSNLDELQAIFGDNSKFWIGMGPPGDDLPDGEKRFGIWILQRQWSEVGK